MGGWVRDDGSQRPGGGLSGDHGSPRGDGKRGRGEALERGGW